MSGLIDLTKDFFGVKVREKIRETKFSFVRNRSDYFRNSLALKVSEIDGVETFAVCPFFILEGDTDQRHFIEALESVDEKGFKNFMAWFDKNAFVVLLHSVVSDEMNFNFKSSGVKNVL